MGVRSDINRKLLLGNKQWWSEHGYCDSSSFIRTRHTALVCFLLAFTNIWDRAKYHHLPWGTGDVHKVLSLTPTWSTGCREIWLVLSVYDILHVYIITFQEFFDRPCSFQNLVYGLFTWKPCVSMMYPMDMWDIPFGLSELGSYWYLTAIRVLTCCMQIFLLLLPITQQTNTVQCSHQYTHVWTVSVTTHQIHCCPDYLLHCNHTDVCVTVDFKVVCWYLGFVHSLSVSVHRECISDVWGRKAPSVHKKKKKSPSVSQILLTSSYNWHLFHSY